MLQPYDRAGHAYMEYLADHGTFSEFPFQTVMDEFRRIYGATEMMRGEHDAAFHDDV